MIADQLALPAQEFLGLLRRVPALPLLRFKRQFDEGCAEAFDFILDRWPHVVRLDDGAEPSRGRDRLETSHTHSQHEHASRRHGACGRDQQREELAEPVGGEEHGLVSRNARL